MKNRWARENGNGQKSVQLAGMHEFKRLNDNESFKRLRN